MNKVLRTLIVLLGLITSLTLHAQKHSSEIVFTEHMNRMKSAKENIYKIKTGHPATGVVFAVTGFESFERAFLVVGNDTLELSNDEHADASSLLTYSNLISFDESIEVFYFCPGTILNQISIYPIDARMPDETEKSVSTKKKSADCSEPETIDQSEWRIGLTPPDYTRIETHARNLIIHHTSGSNTNTNYVQVVRNIYIDHTEIKGWSDIGYNYLIAQNGIIFKGRDPDQMEQDNLLGAHFCASNSFTMGVSLLGNYTEIAPPDTAIRSLIKLLSWKAGKDSLNPIGKSPHALNFNLGVIAGHRDGCATECPGNEVYKILPQIRNEVNNEFEDCNYFAKPLAIANSSASSLKVVAQNSLIDISGIVDPNAVIVIYNTVGQAVSYTKIQRTAEALSIKPNIEPGILLIVAIHNEYRTQTYLVYY